MAGDTRARLLEGALDTLRTQGIAGASARSIAAAAGVNQALVFYHFGSVDVLLAAALRHGAEERAAGSVAVLAQMLAGGQTDTRLAPATAAGLDLWVTEIEAALARIIPGT